MNWKEFLFTGLYTGYFPKASGTVGALLALLFYVLLHQVCGRYGMLANVLLVALVTYPAIKLGNEAEVFFAKKDPQEVVLDEMLGYWVTMLFQPFSISGAALGFFFFRLFDIIKPYPIRRLEHFKGGLGIMIDDIIAGVYANITVAIIMAVMKTYGIMLV